MDTNQPPVSKSKSDDFEERLPFLLAISIMGIVFGMLFVFYYIFLKSQIITGLFYLSLIILGISAFIMLEKGVRQIEMGKIL